MYIIINKTKGTKNALEGDFPSNYLEERLEEGDDLIVISTYSNTIKVPFREDDNRSETGYTWSFKDFSYSDI